MRKANQCVGIRQTDRQTDRHTDRQTDIQTDRQTEYRKTPTIQLVIVLDPGFCAPLMHMHMCLKPIAAGKSKLSAALPLPNTQQRS